MENVKENKTVKYRNKGHKPQGAGTLSLVVRWDTQRSK
jgi:hypothetical protein